MQVGGSSSRGYKGGGGRPGSSLGDPSWFQGCLNSPTMQTPTEEVTGRMRTESNSRAITYNLLCGKMRDRRTGKGRKELKTVERGETRKRKQYFTKFSEFQDKKVLDIFTGGFLGGCKWGENGNNQMPEGVTDQQGAPKGHAALRSKTTKTFKGREHGIRGLLT